MIKSGKIQVNSAFRCVQFSPTLLKFCICICICICVLCIAHSGRWSEDAKHIFRQMHPTFSCRICRNQWGTKNEWIYFFKNCAFVNKAIGNFDCKVFIPAFQCKTCTFVNICMWSCSGGHTDQMQNRNQGENTFWCGSVQKLRALLVVRSLAANFFHFHFSCFHFLFVLLTLSLFLGWKYARILSSSSGAIFGCNFFLTFLIFTFLLLLLKLSFFSGVEVCKNCELF